MKLLNIFKFTGIMVMGITLISPYANAQKDNHLKVYKFIETCQRKSGASDQDYKMLIKKKAPRTKEGLCMLECVFNKLRVIENGKFNKNGFVLTFSPAAMGDFTKMSKLRKMGEVCEKEIGTDQKNDCRTSKELLECIARNKDGLTFKTDVDEK